MKRVVHEILKLSSLIRYAGIIDTREIVFYGKMNTNKLDSLPADIESEFAFDLLKITESIRRYNKYFGNTIFMHIGMERVNMLVYLVGNYIVGVSCDHVLDGENMLKISNQIEKVINKATIIPIPSALVQV